MDQKPAERILGPNRGITGNTSDTELIKWWTDHAEQWLAHPSADSELLYVASIALARADPAISLQCIEECRYRRKRTKK